MKLIECPRDAMQGVTQFIPTKQKIKLIQSLLNVGFDTIDFGSFVSPKVIPQMQDTSIIIEALNLSNSKSKLLAIVGNLQGAKNACQFSQISYLGFPFSISEIFQKNNINSTVEKSFNQLYEIQNLIVKSNKQLVVYISMAFGNPYGEQWDIDKNLFWIEKIVTELDVQIISLSDTVGKATPQDIIDVYQSTIKEFDDIEIGLHLHLLAEEISEKLEAISTINCKRIDGVINGLGGCPFADNKLIGNMPTEKIIDFFNQKNISLSINEDKLKEAITISNQTFNLN